MKEVLVQYASFNVWATQRIADIILALPEEKQKAEIPSSYSSLFKTLLHMLDAESIWWQRLKLQERLIIPSQEFAGNIKELVAELHQQSKRWEEWVQQATPLSVDHVFQYKTLTGEQFKQPTWQMLLHVFNHATYHRGQLINMLRQLGMEKLPSTDFIKWARGEKK